MASPRWFDRQSTLYGAAVVGALADTAAGWWPLGRLTCCVLLLVALAFLAIATYRGSLRLRWWAALIPALLAARLLGDGVRVAALPTGDGMTALGAMFDFVAATFLAALAVMIAVVLVIRSRPPTATENSTQI